MKKVDYIILAISYILITVTFALRPAYESGMVTNPNFSDYNVKGFGELLGSFLLASVITLPLQFFSGWDKKAYISKTIKGMLMASAIASLSIFA